MRDVVLTAFIFGALPFILRWPWVGILMWNWIGIMNPHRLTYGFAYDMQFAQIVAIVTIVGAVFSREPKRFPLNVATISLLALIAWMSFTHLFALAPADSYEGLIKMLKIQFAILLGLVLMQERVRVHLLTWVLVLSIGFYGVKGGIFTLTGGGGQRVLGPSGSFIEGNTEIGLALLMMIPLMRYLQLNEPRRWVRWGLALAMMLSGIAILGTQSRGALVGGSAMATLFWLKSRHKVPLGVAMVVIIPAFLMFMPDTWWARMGTMFTYEQDGSAMGRIDAWKFAFSLAMNRPIVGGGFNVFLPETFAIYAPGLQARAGHSIYFDMIGHHGFVGLGLFVLLMVASWRTGSRIMLLTKNVAEQRWAYDLAAMCQVCLIGFWTGGAFLSLSYFDGYYVIISLLVLTRVIVERELKARSALPPLRTFDSPLRSSERVLSVDRK